MIEGSEADEAVAILGLGANLGDRIGHVRRAIAAIGALDGVRSLGCSALYESDPVGYTDQPRFINAAVAVAASLGPDALLRHTGAIERRMGRVRTFRNAPREIDIDLLFYEDLVRNDAALELPHPRYAERAFVVVPVLELLERLRLKHPYWRNLLEELRENPRKGGLDRLEVDH